ncbi:MAG: hypothetical protein ACHQXA_05865 [Gemmatimonadales bacterium]
MNSIPADTLRRVLDRVFADSAYAWHQVAVRPVPEWFRRVAAVFAWFGRLWDRLMTATSDGWLPLPWLLVALVVLIVVHAVFRLSAAARTAREGDLAGPIPGGWLRDAAWFDRQAETLAAGGRFGEAMLAAFHGAMLDLDGRGLVRYQASRTPNEFVRAAGLPDPERLRLRALVRDLYRAAFAGEAVPREAYGAWLAELRRVVDAPAH